MDVSARPKVEQHRKCPKKTKETDIFVSFPLNTFAPTLAENVSAMQAKKRQETKIWGLNQGLPFTESKYRGKRAQACEAGRKALEAATAGLP